MKSKTITKKEMMKENEKFFNNIIRIMKNGGIYSCPNTNKFPKIDFIFS